VAQTTVAKAYRLLKAVLQTAADDELIRRNPCRITGAGREEADKRPVATVEQVDALADTVGPRWRPMVFLAAYTSLRPEEQAELRRTDITFEDGVVVLRISRAALELTTGRRAVGGPKSRAGKRIVVLPGFLTVDIRAAPGLVRGGGAGRAAVRRRARRAVPPLDIRPQVAQGPRRRRSPTQLPLLRPGYVGECRGM
jgi:integrase